MWAEKQLQTQSNIYQRSGENCRLATRVALQAVLSRTSPYHYDYQGSKSTPVVVLFPVHGWSLATAFERHGGYCMHGCKVQSASTTTVSCISSLHAYSYIQESGRSVKTMNAKNSTKSPIRENADANITCDFGDISRFRSRLPHTHTAISLAQL